MPRVTLIETGAASGSHDAMTNSQGNVLVTGGAGYIGSHACKALAAAGYLPIAYDNLCYGHDWAVRWGPLERGDILDRSRLDDVMEEYEPVALIHFAAFAYVGEFGPDPGKYYRNNVAGSLGFSRPCVIIGSVTSYSPAPAQPTGFPRRSRFGRIRRSTRSIPMAPLS